MIEKPLEIKPITLEDKEVFGEYFKNLCSVSSDFTFTNLFMWQPSYNLRYSIIDGVLCIFSRHGDSPEYATFPGCTENLKGAVKAVIQHFEGLGQTPFIRICGEEQAKRVGEMFPDTFYFTEDVNSNDYVYSIEKLIKLSGKKYHAKRNHVNRFISSYDYEYHAMTPGYAKACREMFDRWCEAKADSDIDVSEQTQAVHRLLDNWEHLDVKGGCITVSGRMAAFSFGEVINRDKSTVVVHLEHADTEFDGSFPMMNREFLINEWSDFEYVNREEDMGLEGLRRAKQSYYPEFMVRKFILTLK